MLMYPSYLALTFMSAMLNTHSHMIFLKTIMYYA